LRSSSLTSTRVEIAVAVEVGERDVLAVRAPCGASAPSVGEPALAVIEQQNVRLELHRQSEIEIAVAVGIAGSRVHADQPARRAGR
jgi:hypothetical protein